MRTPLLALMLTFGLASATAASPITFTFAATQISATTPGGLASLAAPFANITGTITYDLATAASSSSATTARYATGALVVDQFDVSTGVFTAPFSINVINSPAFPAGQGDYFQLLTGASTLGTAPGTYDFVNLRLFDDGGLALASTALPATLGLYPTFNALNFERIFVTAGGGTGFLGATNYTLTSVQPAATAVPEQTSTFMLLLGTGLAGLAAHWRRRVLR